MNTQIISKFGICVNWMQVVDQKPDYHLDWPNVFTISIKLISAQNYTHSKLDIVKKHQLLVC